MSGVACISVLLMLIGMLRISDCRFSQEILRLGKTFCPAIPFCADNSTDGSEKSCCERCFCSGSCAKRRSCCPDVDVTSFEPETRSTCIDGYIRNGYYEKQRRNEFLFKRLPTFNYEMVVNCPDNSDCLTFLGNSSSSPEDLVTVYDEKANVLYKNRECAECNGVSEYIMWNLVLVQCSASKTVLDKKLKEDVDEAIEFVLQSCALLPYPPPRYDVEDFLCFLEEHEDVISECNVTGTVVDHDTDLEDACLDPYYASWYMVSYGGSFGPTTVYRNVFCYLCNSDSNLTPGHSLCKTIDRDSLPDFSRLFAFDFQRTEGSDKKTSQYNSTCRKNEIFDRFHKTCRVLHCFDERVPYYGECNAIKLTIIGRYAYEVPIGLDVAANEQLEPNSLDSNQILAIMRSVKDVIQAPSCTFDYIRYYVSIFSEGNFVYYIQLILGFIKSQTCQYTDVAQAITKLEMRKESVTVSFETSAITFIVEYSKMYYSAVHPSQILISANNTARFDNLNYILMEKPFECPYIILNKSEYCEIIRQYQAIDVDSETDVCPVMFDTAVRSISLHDEFAEYCVCFNTLQKLIDAPKTESSTLKGILSLSVSIVSMLSIITSLVIFLSINKLKSVALVIFANAKVNLFAAQAVFLLGTVWEEHYVACVTIGIGIHIFWLAAVFAMTAYCAIVTIYLTRVYRSYWRISLVSFSFIYGLPICFVIANIIYSSYHAGGHKFYLGYGSDGCQIDNRDMRLYLFGLPILATVTVNCLLCGVSIYRIRLTSLAVSSSRKNVSYAGVYFRLLVITGVAWLFGFVNEFVHSLVLDYVFIFTAAGQGFFLLISMLLSTSFRQSLRWCKRHETGTTPTQK